MAWDPPREAIEVSTRIFEEELAPPSLEGFMLGIDRSMAAPVEGDLYDDALNDLVRLVDEYRFEVATAALYIEALGRELALLNETSRTAAHLGISPKAMAFLSSNVSTYTPPHVLLESPETRIPATRLLGGWWAGQLIDSALLRGLSSLDRVATMLALRDGSTLDANRLPVFRRDSLKKLRRWRGQAEWDRLRGLLNHPLFDYVKQYRDGFVHRRREPIELHGEHVAVWRGEDGKSGIYRGMDPGMQLGLAVEFFRLVLSPAVEAAGALIGAISPPLE
ncbi:hypothetical protein [Amnibacterium kyonggiense]|uniref:Cthe-2314-like HEPN domain-containing protein n=1 Tax=Amnibacterium kyonggiense TaxID=595671 RepID=A0A4R7FP60_9MICO|nr:hypothetical protein [Amnibacterium kyonggiense]TDS79520.1 hypothetical protein CLV52_0049 [Amnibacterium kyonggiense]